jgi:hypothetical protein
LFFVLFVFVLCLVYPMLPVSLDCPFLIAQCCQFLSRLSILDCPFGFLQRLFSKGDYNVKIVWHSKYTLWWRKIGFKIVYLRTYLTICNLVRTGRYDNKLMIPSLLMKSLFFTLKLLKRSHLAQIAFTAKKKIKQ